MAMLLHGELLLGGGGRGGRHRPNKGRWAGAVGEWATREVRAVPVQSVGPEKEEKDFEFDIYQTFGN
jgi:hypothetical protein